MALICVAWSSAPFGEAREDGQGSPEPAAGAPFSVSGREEPGILAMHWRVTKRMPAVSEIGGRHVIVQMERGEEIDFILDSGLAITRRADGSFLIDETGEVLWPVDPSSVA